MITDYRIKQIIRESIWDVVLTEDAGQANNIVDAKSGMQPQQKVGNAFRNIKQAVTNRFSGNRNKQNSQQGQQDGNQQADQNGMRPRPRGYFNGPFKQLTSEDYYNIIQDLVNNANLNKAIGMALAGKLGLDPNRAVESKPLEGSEQNNGNNQNTQQQSAQTGSTQQQSTQTGSTQQKQPQGRDYSNANNGSQQNRVANVNFGDNNQNKQQPNANESIYRYGYDELLYEGEFWNRLKGIGREFKRAGKAWNEDRKGPIRYIKKLRYFRIDIDELLKDDTDMRKAVRAAIKTRIRDLWNQTKTSYQPRTYSQKRGTVSYGRLRSTREEGHALEDELKKTGKWSTIGYETQRTIRRMQDLWSPEDYWEINDEWLKYVYYKLKRMGIYYR